MVERSIHRAPWGGSARRAILARSALAAVAFAGVFAAGTAAAGAALPDGRGYELVSPGAEKGGGELTAGFTYVSPDGERVVYSTMNPFGDASNGMGILGNNLGYAAARSAAGWRSTFVTNFPQPETALQPNFFPFVQGASPDLSSIFLRIRYGDEPGFQSGAWASDPQGANRLVAEAPEGSLDLPNILASSTDGTHKIVMTADGVPLTPIPGDPTVTGRLVYDVAGGTATLLNVDNDGQLLSESGAAFAAMDIVYEHVTTLRNPVSADGSRVFFYSQEPGAAPGDPRQLYVRIGQSQTVQLTDSPQPVAFAGASADGTRSFFTSSAQLTTGAVGTGPFLYQFHLPQGQTSGTLSLVAGDDHAVTDTFQSSSGLYTLPGTMVADDGSRVYYHSPDGGGSIYVYSTATEATKLVAGGVGESRLATVVGQNFYANIADITSTGSHFTFLTSTPFLPGDTVTGQQIYLYDDAAGAVRRVSASPEEPEDFNAAFYSEGAGASQVFPLYTASRSNFVSENGRYVFFQTDARLVMDDKNGTTDVYRWGADGVRLISDGLGRERSLLTGASKDGSTVFFITMNDLLPAFDGDGYNDIYAARIGGGFTPPPGISDCAGDVCQGPLTPTPFLPVPGSDTFVGSGDHEQIEEPAPTVSVRAMTARAKRRLARTGKVTLIVTTSAPGQVVAEVSAKRGTRWLVGGTAAKTASRAGRLRLPVTLDGPTRRYLAGRPRGVEFRVDVGYSTGDVTRRASFKLRPARATRRARSRGTRARNRGMRSGRKR